MIKLLVNDEEVKFERTIFPDGTSQIWKLEQLPASPFIESDDDIKIVWMFENEGEIMHVVQLAQLVQREYGREDTVLVCPYLPYGRQDKDIANNKSFALHTFASILYNANICRVETYDAHSSVETETYIASTPPTEFHKSLIKDHDVVIYPDKGAKERYGSSLDLPTMYCEKIRDQLSGEILGLKVNGDADLTDKRVLIVDDICDGGMTFIKVAEALKPYNPKEINLAVSHGLFSKGKGVLVEAGITNIYTTNSLLRNPMGFKVC